jgi:hypothetical protein
MGVRTDIRRIGRWKIPSVAAADALTVGVGTIGTVSGVLIEFIAAIAFWLYARAARQFGAFHICLERTHRYLIAYKIADGMKEHKDATFRDLVCIMANASTITRADIEAVGSHEGKVSAAFSRAPVAAATRDRG